MAAGYLGALLTIGSRVNRPPSPPPSEPVSLAIVNAHVWTGEPTRPWAGAVAVRAGRLAAVGSSAEVQKLVTAATRVVDAHGAMVVPGSTIEEALRAYTSGAAYAEFQEHDKGTLAPGKLADFVLLDRDLTRTPAAELRNARVLMTVAGGTPVYERLPQQGRGSPGPAAP